MSRVRLINLQRVVQAIIRFAAIMLLSIISWIPSPAIAATSKVLPVPESDFKGKIGITYRESKPDFPKPIVAPAKAPNLLLVLLDDVGFGQTGTFGGPIDTPNLTSLAEQGLR